MKSSVGNSTIGGRWGSLKTNTEHALENVSSAVQAILRRLFSPHVPSGQLLAGLMTHSANLPLVLTITEDDPLYGDGEADRIQDYYLPKEAQQLEEKRRLVALHADKQGRKVHFKAVLTSPSGDKLASSRVGRQTAAARYLRVDPVTVKQFMLPAVNGGGESGRRNRADYLVRISRRLLRAEIFWNWELSKVQVGREEALSRAHPVPRLHITAECFTEIERWAVGAGVPVKLNITEQAKSFQLSLGEAPSSFTMSCRFDRRQAVLKRVGARDDSDGDEDEDEEQRAGPSQRKRPRVQIRDQTGYYSAFTEPAYHDEAPLDGQEEDEEAPEEALPYSGDNGNDDDDDDDDDDYQNDNNDTNDGQNEGNDLPQNENGDNRDDHDRGNGHDSNGGGGGGNQNEDMDHDGGQPGGGDNNNGDEGNQDGDGRRNGRNNNDSAGDNNDGIDGDDDDDDDEDDDDDHRNVGRNQSGPAGGASTSGHTRAPKRKRETDDDGKASNGDNDDKEKEEENNHFRPRPRLWIPERDNDDSDDASDFNDSDSFSSSTSDEGESSSFSNENDEEEEDSTFRKGSKQQKQQQPNPTKALKEKRPKLSFFAQTLIRLAKVFLTSEQGQILMSICALKGVQPLKITLKSRSGNSMESACSSNDRITTSSPIVTPFAAGVGALRKGVGPVRTNCHTLPAGLLRRFTGRQDHSIGVNRRLAIEEMRRMQRLNSSAKSTEGNGEKATLQSCEAAAGKKDWRGDFQIDPSSGTLAFDIFLLGELQKQLGPNAPESGK